MIDTIGPDMYQNCVKAKGSTWAENIEARKTHSETSLKYWPQVQVTRTKPNFKQAAL